MIAIGQSATGVVAIGQLSTGVIAIGQLARGVIAVGQLSLGIATIGQISVGALWAGGIGIGGTAGPGLVLPLFGRFRLRPTAHRERWRPTARTPQRLAVATILWLAVATLVSGVALRPIPGILSGRGTTGHVGNPTTTTTTVLR